MSVIQLYFILTTHQLLHGTEEYLTGFSERSKALYGCVAKTDRVG